MYSFVTGLLLLLAVVASYAHVTEIRVNQAQDGSLTWYLISYHGYNECGIANSGLTINGVNYPLESSNAGDASLLSPNIFAQHPYVNGSGRRSYAIVRTPFLGTTLNVQPYSSNACYAFMVGGSGNFTPPPPPVCTSSPLTGWSNTVAAAGNNKGTCDMSDDQTSATIKVNHLACANITGDKQFKLIFDPEGANISYGPFTYNSGVETSVTIAIPYGTSSSTQVDVVDEDFPANIKHGLSIPNGKYLGEKETVLPTITAPANTTVSTGINCAATNVALGEAVASDNCSGVVVTNNAPASFSIGNTTVTWTATDASGNMATAQQVVTVIDNVAPVAKAQNITVQLDATGNATITADAIENGSSDACGIASYAIDKTTFDCSNVGPNTVRLTVKDIHGNQSWAEATVQVEEKVAPIARTKDITVTLANGTAVITPQMIDNNSADVCGIASLTLNRSAFDCSNIGVNTVTLTVTDKSGNVSEATAKVNVIGATPAPSIKVIPSANTYTGADVKTIFLGYGAQSVTLSASDATSAAGATSYSWTAVDGLSAVTGASPIFTPGAAGIYMFTVTATNEYGCKESATVSINVIDAQCGKKNEKVLVCHKGQEICIASSAVKAHLAHGCTLGACTTNATQAVSATATAVEMQQELVAFPNPFTSQTNIEFTMQQAGKYSLALYDMRGVLVTVIAEGNGEANSYLSFEVTGANLTEGLYIARLTTTDGVKNIKIIRKR